MSWDILKQRLKYHYKKYCAIAFAVIGISLLVGNDAYLVIDQIINHESPSFTGLFNIFFEIIIIAAYLLILIGNIEGTNRAITGLLIFVFYVAWDFGATFLFSGIAIISSLSSGGPILILISLAVFVFLALSLLSGIMTYVRTRQFLSGRYIKSEGVRNWCLVFMICTIASSGVLPIYEILQNPSAPIFLAFLTPLSEAAMSVACFFTILRLKGEY